MNPVSLTGVEGFFGTSPLGRDSPQRDERHCGMKKLSQDQIAIAGEIFNRFPFPEDPQARKEMMYTLIHRWAGQYSWTAEEVLLGIELGYKTSGLDKYLARDEFIPVWRTSREEIPNLPPAPPRTAPLSSFTEKPLKWLIPSLVPTASVTFLAGDADTGKSTLMCAWVAQATLGQLPGVYAGKPINVLWVAGEETIGQYVRPRVRLSGGDVSRVQVVIARPWRKVSKSVEHPIHIPEGLEALEYTAGEFEAKLVIFDPLTNAFTRGYKENSQEDARDAMQPLMHMCDELDLAVLGIGHFGKNKKDGRSIMGSGALEAVVRNSIWTYTDPTSRQRYFGLHKGNNVKERISYTYDLHETEVDGVATASFTGVDSRSIEDIADSGDRFKIFADLDTLPDRNNTTTEKILAEVKQYRAHPYSRIMESTGIALSTFERAVKKLDEDGLIDRSRRDPGQHRRRWLCLPDLPEEDFNSIVHTYNALEMLTGGGE